MQDNVIVLSFSDSKIPEFKELKGKEWVYFGDEDNYPEYLLMLFNKSAKHGAIINNKVTYIFGGGLKAELESDATKNFLDHANPAQSWNELIKQSIIDIEVFGGFYWQVIPNMLGKKYTYLMPFSKVRVSKDGKKYYFKNNWKDRNEEMKCFDNFSKDATDPTIFQFKEYRPSLDNRYALPCYVSCCNYIESDIEVSKHCLTNAKTGFSASKMVSFFNGEPDEEKKRSIKRRFDNSYTGSEGQKIILSYNNPTTQAPIVSDLGASDLTKEDFNAQDSLITNNIFAGHQITSPMLFGIQEPGKLGGHNELRISYEIFKNTYASNKQKQIEDVINYFASFMGVATKFTLIPVDPVGVEFSDATLLAAAPKSWLLEKMGIDASLYTDSPIGATAAPVTAASEGVNDNIKNLTAKQHQQLTRIIRQFTKGQLTKEAATTLLKTGLGLNDQDIQSLLGQQFQATEEDACIMFEAFGESMEGYDVLKSKPLAFNEQEEESEIFEMFRNAGDIIAKVKTVMPKFIVRYSYDKRPEAQGSSILPTTRPFCKKMVTLNRYYSREDIQKIGSFLGYNVFDRTGGFWNNNGVIESHCRHEWKTNIVIKRVV